MPTSIELFAGAGGMALGFRQVGFEHPHLVEWDERAIAVLRANASRDPELWALDAVVHSDVRKWLSGVTGADYANLDLLAGGPPCQPFSHGGAHAGHNDRRNMFPAAIDALRLMRPKVAVFENVPGLLRVSFRGYYDYVLDQVSYPSVVPKQDEQWTTHHARIRKHAKKADPEYVVSFQIINAADLGVPQTRKRVFLMAIRADVQGAHSWGGVRPTHSGAALLAQQFRSKEYWEVRKIKPIEPTRADLLSLERASNDELKLLPWRTVRDALDGLPTPKDGQEHPTILNHWGIPGARTYKGHTGSEIDRPSKTLKAGVHGVCGGEAMIHFHDGSLRYMSIREAARIQGFPDDYEFVGSRSAAMWTIGNAVAVPVAREIGGQLGTHVGLKLDS